MEFSFNLFFFFLKERNTASLTRLQNPHEDTCFDEVGDSYTMEGVSCSEWTKHVISQQVSFEAG